MKLFIWVIVSLIATIGLLAVLPQIVAVIALLMVSTYAKKLNEKT